MGVGKNHGSSPAVLPTQVTLLNPSFAAYLPNQEFILRFLIILYLLSDSLKPHFGCFLMETNKQCLILGELNPGFNSE